MIVLNYFLTEKDIKHCPTLVFLSCADPILDKMYSFSLRDILG